VHSTDGLQSSSEQVIIEPGKKLIYTNSTHLNTPSGIGLGVYEMRDMNSGHIFMVDMPTFSLDSPYEEHMPA
jgi:ApaG protein